MIHLDKPGECCVRAATDAPRWIQLGAPFVYVYVPMRGIYSGMYPAANGTLSGIVWPAGEPRPIEGVSPLLKIIDL